MSRLAKLQPLDLRITAGPRASFGEVAGASFRREQEVGELTSRDRFTREAYKPLLDQMQIDRSGPGPARVKIQGQQLSSDIAGRLTDQDFAPDDATLTDLFAEIEERQIAMPDDVTPDSITSRVDRVTQELLGRVSRSEEIMARGRGATRVLGPLAGGFAAGFDNIESVITAPIGAASRAGILATALIEGGVAGLTEAATTPTRNEFLRSIGLPEESALENALFGFAVGGTLGASLRTATRAGELLRDRKTKRAISELGRSSDDPVVREAADRVLRDVEEEEAGTTDTAPEAVREHRQRAQEAAEAARTGEPLQMNDRPVFTRPAASIVNGEIEEVDPRALEVQPEVFQFKSDIVGEGGVTKKLADVTSWKPERAGITLVYEYADGTRAVADGHQRTALARRIMEAGGEDIRLAARVYREADGFTPEDVRVLAALKNIAEAADGMTTAMARDAAKVLRVRPEAIGELPAGPGIARAQALSSLSDDAFSMFINQVVPERFAELVGRMVENPEMHTSIMRLIERTRPETTAQAESIIAQALEAPTSRETTADLFGEQEVVESLFLERAKVLERASRIMRDDRSVFKTLDERADRIQSTGENRLDADTNKRTREQTEQSLAAVKALAHRAGPISEALNDGAKVYKESGRLKDAAQRVVDAVRQEVERNGLSGAGAGPSRSRAKPASEGSAAPDPAEGFSDPVNGEAVQSQVAATRIQPQAAPEPPSVESVVGSMTADGPRVALRRTDMTEPQFRELDRTLREGQPGEDLDGYLKAARRNHKRLNDRVAQIAREQGAEFNRAPAKTRASASRKLKHKYGDEENFRSLTDAARAGLTVRSPEEARRVLTRLSETFHVVDEGFVQTPQGYFDAKVMVRFDDGQLGEFQIWPPGMFDAKERQGGHQLYEEFRLPETTPERKAELDQQMRELYGSTLSALDASWSRFGGGDAPSSARISASFEAGTSTARSSDSTARAVSSEGSDQALPDQTDAALRDDATAATFETSNRNSFMGNTSDTDIGNTGRSVNMERTAAGDQGLFDGVEPITERDRLQQRMDRPMGQGGAAGDQSQIGGIFDPKDPGRFDMFDAVPVGRAFDDEGNEISVTKSRAELAAELDADDEAVETLDLCVKG